MEEDPICFSRDFSHPTGEELYVVSIHCPLVKVFEAVLMKQACFRAKRAHFSKL